MVLPRGTGAMRFIFHYHCSGSDPGNAAGDHDRPLGQGGGHDIAAGAMIPFDSKDNFLNLVNDMVEYQINND